MQAGFPYPVTGNRIMDIDLIPVERLISERAGNIDLVGKMRKLSSTPVHEREKRLDLIKTINVTLLVFDLPQGHDFYKSFADCLRREVRKSRIGLRREKSDRDYIHGHCGDLALIHNFLRHYEMMSSRKDPHQMN